MVREAMALAAGEGTRLFPLPGENSKPRPPSWAPISHRTFDLLSHHYATEASADFR